MERKIRSFRDKDVKGLLAFFSRLRVYGTRLFFVPGRLLCGRRKGPGKRRRQETTDREQPTVPECDNHRVWMFPLGGRLPFNNSVGAGREAPGASYARIVLPDGCQFIIHLPANNGNKSVERERRRKARTVEKGPLREEIKRATAADVYAVKRQKKGTMTEESTAPFDQITLSSTPLLLPLLLRPVRTKHEDNALPW